MNPGPCTYAAACIAMRVFRIPVTAGRRRYDVPDEAREAEEVGEGCLIVLASMVGTLVALVAVGIAVWRWW